MRKVLILCVLMLFTLNTKSQQQVRCNTDEHQAFLEAEDSAYITTREMAKQIIAAYRSAADTTGDTAIITIPVVVHRIGNSVINSVSTNQVNRQIAILNEDYGKIPNTHGYGNGVDTRIRFCLAILDENNGTTSGIVDKYGTYPSVWNRSQPDTAVDSDWVLKHLSHWNPTQYLNMYVVDAITNSQNADILGYATFPWYMSNIGGADRDGVVIAKNGFGDTQGAYHLGKTATHEVGHWLGLYHTFQGGCTNFNPDADGDEVADTPPESSANYICTYPQPRNTCHTDNPDLPDQIENYMNYSYDTCLNMFTQGQARRIRDMLYNYRNPSIFKSCNGGSGGGSGGGGGNGNPSYPPNHPWTTENEKNGCNNWIGSGFGYDNGLLGCTTVRFLINSHETWNVVNVCSSNIILYPYNYVTQQSAMWAHKLDESLKLCTKMDNMWQAARKDNKPFGYCKCYWLSIMITIQECDENLNLIGTEYSEWKYHFDGDQNNYNERNSYYSIDFNQFVPSGFQQFQDGKYYKIKVSSYAHGAALSGRWIEHSGYIRTYKDSLFHINKTVTKHQFADYVEIKNSTVPAVNNVSVVAISQIRIAADSTGSTSLKNGRYYIDTTLSCNNPPQFRIAAPNAEMNGYGNVSANESPAAAATKKKDNITASKPDEIKLFPNPNTGEFKIVFTGAMQTQVSVSVINLLGISVYENNYSNTNEININLKEAAKGVYMVKVISDGKLFTQKVVVN